jgi:hypothetical protein
MKLCTTWENHAGWQMECVATNRAVYIGSYEHGPKVGPNVGRIPYEDIVSIEHTAEILVFQTRAGRVFEFHFRKTTQHFIDVVAEHLPDAVSPP